VKEKTKNGKVFLMYCPTNQMIIDVLTKPLPQKKHNDCFFSFKVYSLTTFKKRKNLIISKLKARAWNDEVCRIISG
jgi:hypothetical protein